VSSSVPSRVEATVLSMGQPTAAASWIWMRTTERYISERATADEIRSSVQQIADTDPTFQTPWVLGALMCERLGEIEVHQDLLALGADRFPSEPWFPWARGMSHWVHDKDTVQAEHWLDRASDIPGAPEIHARAAEALRK